MNVPFMYRFGLTDTSGGIVWLTGPQTINTLDVTLPGGNPLTLVARVTDKSGSYVDTNASCIVTPQPSVGAGILNSQLSNITSRYHADKDWRTFLADTTSFLLQANSTAAELPSSLKDSLLEQVSGILSGPLPQTSADYSVVTSMLSLITNSPGGYNAVMAMSIAEQLAGWFGSQTTLDTYNVLPGPPDGSQPSVLLSNTSGALNPNSTSALAAQTAQKLLDSMSQIASTTSAKSAATLYTSGVQNIGRALCKQIVTGEKPIALSTPTSQLYVQRGVPMGAFNVSNLLVDFGSTVAATYNSSSCRSPLVACDEACIQGVTYTRDLFANSTSLMLQLSPSAEQKINSSIAGINMQGIVTFSSIFSVTVSIPNQNRLMNVSGLPSPFQVYIPAQMLPSQQNLPLCFYRSLVNASSAPSDSSYLWKLDSTAPPLNTTIGGKQYFVCSFTHLTDFVIGSLPPPVIVTKPPPIATTTSVKVSASSSVYQSKSRKVPTIFPTTAPRTTIVTAQADVVTPAVASVLPISFVILAVVGAVVIFYLVWRKKHRGTVKVTPVETQVTQPELVKKPSTLLLPPEQAKVPMQVIRLTESGERQKVGTLNILPSIRLRELRQQITEDMEPFKGKPFYLLTKQLSDIEPAAEQQMFVSLVYGNKYIFVRDVSDRDEYARQFCTCGKAAQFLCTGCTSQGYCSEECQNDHWVSQHQRECAVLSEKKRRNEILHQHRPMSIAGMASNMGAADVKTTASDWKSFLRAAKPPPPQVAIKISPEKADAGSGDNKAASQPTSSEAVASPLSRNGNAPEVACSPDRASFGPASPQQQGTSEQTSVHIASPDLNVSSPLHQITSPEPTSPVASPVVIVDQTETRPSVLSPMPQPQATLGPTNRLPQMKLPGIEGSRQFVAPLPKIPSFLARGPPPPLVSPVTTPATHPFFLAPTPLPRPGFISPTRTTTGVATSPYLPVSPVPNANALSPNPLSPVPGLQPALRIQPQALFNNRSPGLQQSQQPPLSPVHPVSKVPPHQQALFEPANPQLQKRPSMFSGEARLTMQSVVPDDLAMSMSLNASMFKKVRDEPLIGTKEEEEGEEEGEATSEEGEEGSEAELKDSEDVTGSSDLSDDAEEEEESTGSPSAAPPPLQPKKK